VVSEQSYFQDVKTIAIVGDGRWAKVYISVLCSLKLPYQLIIVSKSNKFQELQILCESTLPLIFVSSIDELLNNHIVNMAIVVNSIRAHFESAQKLIDKGISVLIEKPISLEENQVDLLFNKAVKKDICIVPALTFLQCSYIQNFSQILSDCNEQPEKITIEWADPLGEVRYGNLKKYDFSVSIAQDVMPHIWSILSEVLSCIDINFYVESCSIQRGGQHVKFASTIKGISCDISLERNSNLRRRFLSAEFKKSPNIELDFTIEPGTLKFKNKILSADQRWETKTIHPIQRQIEFFISQVENQENRVNMKPTSSGSISALKKSDSLLKKTQKTWLSSIYTPLMSDDISYAISELATSEFYNVPLDNLQDRQVLKSHILSFIHYINEHKKPSDDWNTTFTRLIDSYIHSVLSNE